MLTKPIFDEMIKSDSIRRCEKKYIWCVNKIFVAITKIFVVSTLNKGWGTGISWMWVWSDDVTTTAPKSAKSPKSPMFLSTIHQNLPDPPFYLLVLLSVRWKPESLFSGCSNTFFQALAIPLKYGKLSLGKNLVGTFESVAAGNTVLSVFTTAASLTTLTTN